METEQAGLEVLSGCCGVVALLFAGVVGVIVRVSQNKVPELERRRLNDLLAEFCSGADQSRNKVHQIQAMLMTTFARDSDYEELTSATASFQPGGQAPFHDEAWLADRYRVFLSKHGIVVPEYLSEQPGVWPPPPNPRA